MKQDELSLREAIERLKDGIYTTQDVNTLSDLRQDVTPLEEAMDKCWEESAYIQTSAAEHEQYKAEAQCLLKKLKRKEQGFRIASVYKYAAVVALLLLSGMSLLWLQSQERTGDTQEVYSELYVPHGQTDSLTLPDGTQVILNSDSRIRYPKRITGNKRLIEIDGEAFLTVSPDTNRPFIVRTDSVDITVLGTSFNVKAYRGDQQVMVSVRSGKVQVNLPEASMNLKPDEMVILNKTNGELEKKQIDSRKTTAWMTGGLFFNKTPLTSVLKELERRYKCIIEIEDESIRQEIVYGEHSNESLESVLNAIDYALGIKHRREDNRIILYK